MITKTQTIVAMRDVEPAALERCALIRDWLGDLGAERVTLFVDPLAPTNAAFDAWLREREAAGDEIAWHQPRRRERRIDIRAADLDRPQRVYAIEQRLSRELA